MKLDVLIRSDASFKIGTGHVFRDLVIADWFRTAGLTVGFASRALPGDLLRRVRDSGFPLFELQAGSNAATDSWLGVEEDEELAALTRLYASLQQPPRWIVADHYGLDATWERFVASLGSRVAAIDDLANRQHDVNVLLDSIVGPADRYAGLVPAHAKVFLGPSYAPVRDAFADERRHARTRSGRIERIGIFYGGVDFTNETRKALTALQTIPGTFAIDVVVGLSNPRRDEIERLVAADPRARIVAGDGQMARATADADLVLGAVGSAIWERCFVGCPSVLTTTLPFVDFIGATVGATGAAIALGQADSVTSEGLATVVRALLDDAQHVRDIGTRAFALCGDFENARTEFMRAFLV